MNWPRVLLSLLLGAISALLVTAGLIAIDAPQDRDWGVHVDEGRVWMVSMRIDPGRSWYCLERHPYDLVQAALELPLDLPAWTMPPASSDADPHRIAALGVGWPFVWLVRRWDNTRDEDATFVPAAELDEQPESMNRALSKLADPATWADARVRTGALLVNVALAAVPWWIILTALRVPRTGAGADTSSRRSAG